MAQNIQDLSVIDNNNQNQWPEGTMKVQDVNDAGRADEGIMARWFADWNGSKITGGTGSAYTLSSDTVPTAYYDGFQVVCEINVDCLADATLNVDSLGAATIKKNGTENLVADDLKAGMVAMFVYRGTDWNLVSAAYLGSAAQKNTGTDIGDVVEVVDTGGGTPGIDPSLVQTGNDAQVFTSSGTFSKSSLPSSVTKVKVTVVGGGGGGGGASTTGGSAASAGSGGGGGGVSIEWLDVSALAASETVTIGAGGAGGNGVAGSAGGSSSFGTFLSATGGAGGNTTGAIGTSGASGGLGSGGDINGSGGDGGAALVLSTTTNYGVSGEGGASHYSGGPPRRIGSNLGGENGTLGAGGSGGCNQQNQAATVGGTGGDGIVVVEY